MRLTHIKLAGFKSFVDPTHIALPGQLVGVVGPNGCGKSNVIDAVRWVLGESSAKHLRGETMQDVIFNGSGERKPVNRASVELVFDNSLGKAAGAWTNYAEISIKRVLERQGESSYYINNIAVRRRDVADIFLGTGLGARAYAIIEQGMISRIVDAKPEELRVFLEEAAGVSKYRERRKETENRLEDARENLLRVEDIRRELGLQITRLEEQAVAAERYRTLEAEIRRSQCLLWSIRRRDAGNLRVRLAGEIGQTATDLERTTAELREVESGLETSRSAHYAAGDAVHSAQGLLYEANAEFARIEQQLQFQRASRNRAESRRRELDDQISRDSTRMDDVRSELQNTEADLEAAVAIAEQSAEQARDAQDAMPETETAFRNARVELDRVRQAITQAQRDREVAIARRDQTDRLLSQLRMRRERLEGELQSIAAPDEAEIERLLQEKEALAEEIQGLQERQSALQARIPQLESAYRTAAQGVESARGRLASLEARRHALVALQQQVGSSEQMAAWLGQHGLSDMPRLWEKVRVEAGWEDAVEAVLRERLNALALVDPARLSDWFGSAPPGKLAVYRPEPAAAGQDAAPAPAGCRALTAVVTCQEPGVESALREWLTGVWAAESAQQAMAAAASLPPGEMVVSREGHMFTAHSMGFHAPDSEIHGLLERKQEIEALEREIPGVENELALQRDTQTDAEAELKEARAELDRIRQRVSSLSQSRHEADLAHMRAAQLAGRARERRSQIEGELAEIAQEQAREHEIRSETDRDIEMSGDASDGLSQELESAEERFHAAEAGLSTARDRTMSAERQWQEAQFEVRGLEARQGELKRGLTGLGDALTRARAALEEVLGELERTDEGPLESELGVALDVKQQREAALARCRDALSEAERDLRGLDERRNGLERQLEPMRTRLGDLRLKEQEARLAEENFAAQLAEARADEAELAPLMEKPPRPNALQAEITRLQEELTGLGAVNLAALDELQKTTERKGFLDAQSADLNEAVATLEDAIRRIDRETRERLKGTFDEVNKNLGEMFPQLFGGGEAKLVMTGEEILDSGVQIIARPPGKKNASIHLLSGGEKALTAVSLVFSLFRLNPAPFCLLDEVDAPLDDSNTSRFCQLVRKMSDQTQFIFISHNKITMELAEQLVGVTMPELGVSRVVAVDIEEALKMREEQAA
ncbi:MAG: chromosome segregation protein SMC [Betaproteobacteria bacterium]|nr:chromosome segregation protein SMC [Betaproteobacteria bacterium]